MRLVIILVVCLFIPGCDLFIKEKIVYKEVKVVVPGKVKPPPAFVKPRLPLSDITQETPDNQVSAAYYESIKILEGEVTKRDLALDEYRKEPSEAKPNDN